MNSYTFCAIVIGTRRNYRNISMNQNCVKKEKNYIDKLKTRETKNYYDVCFDWNSACLILSATDQKCIEVVTNKPIKLDFINCGIYHAFWRKKLPVVNLFPIDWFFLTRTKKNPNLKIIWTDGLFVFSQRAKVDFKRKKKKHKTEAKIFDDKFLISHHVPRRKNRHQASSHILFFLFHRFVIFIG